MNKWAVIFNAKVTNVVVSDGPPLVQPGYVSVNITALSPQPQIGWMYLDHAFQPPSVPGVNLDAYLTQKMYAAMDFGKSIIVQFAVMNIKAGRTPSEIADMASRLVGVQMLLMSGSLYTAMAAMDAVHTDNLITADTITMFKNQIKIYLGVTS